MHCFYHQSIPAIGICKHCSKGICSECAADLGHGLACKGKHEQEVENVQAMISRATQVQSTNTTYKYMSPIFFLVIGSIFFCSGLFLNNRSSTFTMILGAAFLIYSAYLFVVVRSAYK